MTTTPPAASDTASEDPRIGRLMDLVQGLITGYGQLATDLADGITDPVTRAKFTTDAQRTIADARARYIRILSGEKP